MHWVKHDTDANQDAKLQNVLLDYGLEGYGLYWYCIELIAGKVDKDNITFELEHDARIIARNVGSTPQKVEEMMRYFVKLGLFENNQGVITCLKLARRLDQSMTSNPQMREIIKNFKLLQSHDDVMMSHDEIMQDKIRLEENREEKKNKEQRIEDAFNKFWISYHKKQGKAQALKAFKAAVKREGIKDLDEFSEMLITDCKERLSAKQFGFDNLNGATYLNNNRWEDEKTSSQDNIESYVKPDWMRGIK